MESFPDACGDFRASITFDQCAGEQWPVLRRTASANILKEDEEVVRMPLIAGKVPEVADFEVDQAGTACLLFVEKVSGVRIAVTPRVLIVRTGLGVGAAQF